MQILAVACVICLTPTEQSLIIRNMKKKDELKEERILNAAVALIAEDGIAGLSMSKLTKASGVPHASIYTYFDSKDELLRQVYAYTIKKMCCYVMDGFDDSLSVQDCLWEYCLRFVDYMETHTDAYLVYEQFMSSPLSKQLQLENVTDAFSPMYGFVEKAQKEGLIKLTLHPIVVLSYFTLPLAGIIKGKIFWGNPSGDFVYRLLFEASWDAVRVHK